MISVKEQQRLVLSFVEVGLRRTADMRPGSIAATALPLLRSALAAQEVTLAFSLVLLFTAAAAGDIDEAASRLAALELVEELSGHGPDFKVEKGEAP